MNERLQELTVHLDALANGIIESLRQKQIHEAAFAQLYEILDEITDLVEEEKAIDKKLGAVLFLIYTQLVTQSGYVYDRSPFIPYIGKMQGYIRKIFGSRQQLVTG
ncbi:hypothetical protein C2I18_02265 [Paenibacillus sp. PK3_47]|uniref:hypothetical protein n=1 Tax=Paenibacillus sp. PK3_47 TaxID=2072642 RepID=UPI00201D2EBB|nr:hypothetical protein [Paenibacillus sp. PK3_47]UQZ32479.1 hypothetical protein C2I18_02265 [Paenibacillus sp. PK3_47]